MMEMQQFHNKTQCKNNLLISNFENINSHSSHYPLWFLCLSIFTPARMSIVFFARFKCSTSRFGLSSCKEEPSLVNTQKIIETLKTSNSIGEIHYCCTTISDWSFSKMPYNETEIKCVVVGDGAVGTLLSSIVFMMARSKPFKLSIILPNHDLWTFITFYHHQQHYHHPYQARHVWYVSHHVLFFVLIQGIPSSSPQWNYFSICPNFTVWFENIIVTNTYKTTTSTIRILLSHKTPLFTKRWLTKCGHNPSSVTQMELANISLFLVFFHSSILFVNTSILWILFVTSGQSLCR